MTLQRLEAELTRETTRIHKDVIGKGPSHTSVKIFENIVIIKLEDALSTFESSVLVVQEGEERIKELRTKLIDEYSHMLVELIARYEECTLVDTLSTVHVSKEEVYIFLILNDDLESCLK